MFFLSNVSELQGKKNNIEEEIRRRADYLSLENARTRTASQVANNHKFPSEDGHRASHAVESVTK